jgi:hypothetical protein
MRDWRIMLGALLVWALHFLLVYGVASLADISNPSQAGLWRTAGAVFTAACLGLLAIIAVRARSETRVSPLARRLGLAGCGLGLIAIVWQSLPMLISA